MKIKIIFILALLSSLLYSTTVQTSKDNYSPKESIRVIVHDMLGNPNDWVGIYPKESTNDWANVLLWDRTGGKVDANITLEKLPVGSYEVRAFFEDSFELESRYSFEVNENALDANITTSKTNYLQDENITVHFSHLLGNPKDWVGIYPKESSNDWNNVIVWRYTKGVLEGNLSFSTLPIGEYDVRVFFDDSFCLESNSSFSVTNPNAVELTLDKEVYIPNELLHVTFDKMQGSDKDWIGVYPAGASYEFKNVIEWRYTDGNSSGTLSLNGLPAGEYDIRAFFNNSLAQEAMQTITVVDIEPTSTLYEDAEDGLNPNWIHISGKYEKTRVSPGFESSGAIRFKAYWLQRIYNPTEFHLPLNINKREKVLEIDMRAKDNPHFNFGLLVETKEGKRIVIWDSFFNHNGANRTVIPPHIKVSNGNVILNNPAPNDYHYSGSRLTFRHYKINVEKVIRNLEPNNELISIDYFVTTGGEYDNIKLSSH